MHRLLKHHLKKRNLKTIDVRPVRHTAEKQLAVKILHAAI